MNARTNRRLWRRMLRVISGRPVDEVMAHCWQGTDGQTICIPCRVDDQTEQISLGLVLDVLTTPRDAPLAYWPTGRTRWTDIPVRAR